MTTSRPATTKIGARTVYIVDDHPVVRRGLTQLINQAPDLTVCGEAEDLPTALDAIGPAKPDVAIVDITLKGRSGLELVKSLGARRPPCAVLVLSMHDETLYAERALRAGARGYIMKEEAPELVLTAIRRILSGQIYVSERMAARLLQQRVSAPRGQPAASPIESFSDRELEVFRLLGQGRSTRQIAETLNLSIKTIETYRAHLMQKLQVAQAPELIQRAVQWVHTEAPVSGNP